MSHGHCSCPECGTILRIRDRSFVGREIQCPDCQIQLEIKLTEEREFIAVPPQAKPKPKRPILPPTAVVVPQIRSVVKQQFGSLVGSPLFMAWALATGLVLFVAAVVLRPSVRFQTTRSSQTKDMDPSRDASGDQQVDSKLDEQPKPLSDAVGTAVGGGPDAESPQALVAQPVPDMAPTPSEKSLEPPVDAGAAPATEKALDAVPPISPAPDTLVAIPPPIDVEKKLNLKMKGFVTKEPLSRARLIEQVTEMLDAPIRFNRDELGEKDIERTIAISLGETTVGGILKAVIDSAGWEYVIEKTGVRLKPRQVAGPMP